VKRSTLLGAGAFGAALMIVGPLAGMTLWPPIGAAVLFTGSGMGAVFLSMGFLGYRPVSRRGLAVGAGLAFAAMGAGMVAQLIAGGSSHAIGISDGSPAAHARGSAILSTAGSAVNVAAWVLAGLTLVATQPIGARVGRWAGVGLVVSSIAHRILPFGAFASLDWILAVVFAACLLVLVWRFVRLRWSSFETEAGA
jgi:hypothetical protein